MSWMYERHSNLNAGFSSVSIGTLWHIHSNESNHLHIYDNVTCKCVMLYTLIFLSVGEFSYTSKDPFCRSHLEGDISDYITHRIPKYPDGLANILNALIRLNFIIRQYN